MDWARTCPVASRVSTSKGILSLLVTDDDALTPYRILRPYFLWLAAKNTMSCNDP